MSRVSCLASFGSTGSGLRRTASALLCGVSLVLLASQPARAADPLLSSEYAAQWGLGMIGAEAAHRRGYTGAGVTVGVVDSGILAPVAAVPDVTFGSPGHPDLVANLSPVSMNGADGGASDGIDRNGHGTHVAGTIAAMLNGVGMVGVAPGAQVASLQIATRDSADIDPATLDATVARLYDFGVANGIEFYNNSWGSDPMMPAGGTELAEVRTFFETQRPQMLAAISRAVEAGSVLVWANGNEGDPGAALEPGLPYLYPELRPNWIAVAAVGQTGTVTNYSNRCGLAAAWCIAAPGGDDEETGGIYSTSNTGGYVRMSGTSMAAPHVTGALAIARQMFPKARATDLAQLVLATATDMGEAGIDAVYGWGLLNLDNLTSTRDAGSGAVFSQSTFARTRMLGQIADIAGSLSGTLDGGAPAQGAVTFSTNGDAPETDFNMRWWAAPIAGLTNTTASAATPSARTRSAGALTGLDFRPSSDVTFGFGVGFSETRTSSAGDRSRSAGVHALAYGGLRRDMWFMDAAAGISRFESTTSRTTIAGLGGAAAGLAGSSSSVDVGTWGNARVGMTFQTVVAAVQPYAQARAMHQWLGSTTETGAGIFALTAPSATSTQTDLGAGLRITGKAWTTGVGEIRPVLDLGYARAIGSLGDSRATTMLGSPVAASAVGIGRDIGRLSAGLAYASASGRVTGTLGYSGEYRTRATSHAINAGLGVKF